MGGLDGKRIAIAADRSSEAISTLIQKQGGLPLVYSIQGQQKLNSQTSSQNVKDFLEKPFDWVVLTTGIGAGTLADSADEEGLHKEFVKKLKSTKLAVRGSKTLDWLKKNNLEARLVSKDGTMENLLSAVAEENQEKSGRQVFLQAYNEDDARLKNTLEEYGYSVYLSQPYSYESPEPGIISDLKKAITGQSIDAVIFTSKTQVRNIFRNQVDNKKLIHSFNGSVLAVAVGKITARDLENEGVLNVFQPGKPKMGAMVVELDRYYQEVDSSFNRRS